ECGRGIAARVAGVAVLQDFLPERRRGRARVAEAAASVERPVVTAVVEANARVVLPGDDVVRVPRVDRDDLLSLPPERAVLVHADVVDSASVVLLVVVALLVAVGAAVVFVIAVRPEDVGAALRRRSRRGHQAARLSVEVSAREARGGCTGGRCG